MISLDMRTLVFSILVTDIVCLLVIILLWRQNRTRFAGLIFWVCDFIFTNATFALIALRGTIPDWASIVLANTFAMIGMFMGYIALLKFTGKRGTQIHNYLLLVAVVSVHTYFTYAQPDLLARNVNIAAGILIISFQCAWLMLYRVPIAMRPVARLVGLVFCGYCLVSIFRFFAVFVGTYVNADYLQSGTFEKMILVSYQVLFIVLTYSLALMFNRRLQMDIRAEQEKFSHAFYSSPYGIIITRASDGLIIEVNQGFVNITGYTVPEVKEKSTIDLHLWAREEDRTLVVNELLQNSSLSNRELFFRKKSGEIITGLFSAELITINNEICVISSISDITERKRAEESLRKTNEQLVFAQQSAGAGIWDWDIMTGKLTWSPELFRLFGLDPTKDEATFDTWNSLVHPDDLAAVSERIQTAIRDHAKLVNEYRVVLPTGETRWINAVGETMYEPGGNAVRMAGICIDITERKLAEGSLGESEWKFRIVADSTYDWEFWVDSQGRIVYCSPSCLGISGHEAAEFMANPDLVDQIVHPDDRAIYADHIMAMQSNSSSEEIMFRILRPDGTERWIGHICQTVMDKDGRIVGRRGSNRDITDRRRAEEEARRLNTELEHRVADRTRDLNNSQLALLNVVDDLNLHAKKLDAANEKMAAANRELEAFSYSVSHDLRAPLRHLGGFVELLKEKLPPSTDEETVHYLTVISNAAAQMSRLVDDLLKFSRMSRAGMTKTRVRFDKLTGETIDTLQPATRGREIVWKIDPLPEVTGDASMLRLVMVNLIANAVKFTGSKPKAEIAIGCDQSNEDEYIFSVRDNGAGFDMRYADKLFHLFQRLHRADEFEGTGAGLANVRRIVERHGGRTWAEGTVGEGAVFYFSLPKT